MCSGRVNTILIAESLHNVNKLMNSAFKKNDVSSLKEYSKVCILERGLFSVTRGSLNSTTNVLSSKSYNDRQEYFS